MPAHTDPGQAKGPGASGTASHLSILSDALLLHAAFVGCADACVFHATSQRQHQFRISLVCKRKQRNAFSFSVLCERSGDEGGKKKKRKMKKKKKKRARSSDGTLIRTYRPGCATRQARPALFISRRRPQRGAGRTWPRHRPRAATAPRRGGRTDSALRAARRLRLGSAAAWVGAAALNRRARGQTVLVASFPPPRRQFFLRFVLRPCVRPFVRDATDAASSHGPTRQLAFRAAGGTRCKESRFGTEQGHCGSVTLMRRDGANKQRGDRVLPEKHFEWSLISR